MQLSLLNRLKILAVFSFIHLAIRYALYYLRSDAPYNIKDNTGCAIQNHLLAWGDTPLLEMAQQSFLYSSNGTHSQFLGYTAYNCSNTTHYKSITLDCLFFLNTYLMPGLIFTAVYQIAAVPKVISRGPTAKVLAAFTVPITKVAFYLHNIALNYFSPGQEDDAPSLPDRKDALIAICKLVSDAKLVCNLAGSVISDLTLHHTVLSNNINKAIIKSAHQWVEGVFVAVLGNPEGNFAFGWTRNLAYDLILPIINKKDSLLLVLAPTSTPNGQIPEQNSALIDLKNESHTNLVAGEVRDSED